MHEKKILLIPGFLIGTISFWLVPYNELKLFGINIYYILLFLTVITAILISRKSPLKPIQIAGGVSIGVLIAQFIRIVYDIYLIPKSHNLLPFEIVLTIFVAFSGSFIPAYAQKRVSEKK